jgi:predicted RNase H-like nuclease
MESSIRIKKPKKEEEDEKEEEKEEEKEQFIDTIERFIDTKHIIHKYVSKYVEWQKEIWKKRLYYPYSLYSLGTIVVSYIFYSLFF